MPRTRADTVIENATVLTAAGGTGPLRGTDQGRIGLIRDGAVAVRGARIVAVGARETVARAVEARDTVDLDGRLLLPGFVDAHTHPIWAGDRAEEFERRLAGATYLEIMATGGGIAATVGATRAATDTELASALRSRLDRMLAHGTTTVEAKTGYGLSTHEELRHLDVLAQVAASHPVRLVPTFLGAHAVPPELRGRQPAYVDLVVDEMMPAVAARHPGIFCDVFCDEGAFTLDETRRILGRAASLGFRLKVHSDEFANLGCTGLAAEIGAVSADHLAATTPAEMDALARAGTVGVLLPGTTFGLGASRYAPGREMVARGVPVALGTDFNPGTCPCESIPMIVALASRYLRLSPAECIIAVTRNAACASGCGDATGRIEAGWAADMIVADCTDYRDLAYRFGTNPIVAAMVGGRWAIRPTAA